MKAPASWNYTLKLHVDDSFISNTANVSAQKTNLFRRSVWQLVCEVEQNVCHLVSRLIRRVLWCRSSNNTFCENKSWKPKLQTACSVLGAPPTGRRSTNSFKSCIVCTKPYKSERQSKKWSKGNSIGSFTQVTQHFPPKWTSSRSKIHRNRILKTRNMQLYEGRPVHALKRTNDKICWKYDNNKTSCKNTNPIMSHKMGRFTTNHLNF